MLIPVVIGVTFMVYFILSLSPGDTAAMIAGETADAETIEAVRKDLGLDQPVIVRRLINQSVKSLRSLSSTANIC